MARKNKNDEYDAEYSGETSRSGWGAWQFMAAGFLVVVVGVAAVLFIVNRGDGDDQAGQQNGDSSANGEEQPLADQYSWEHKEADPFGQMVYAAEDRRGQVLSDTTREYDSADDAANAAVDDVVFQATDFSGRVPIPFSKTDGPTGFDGTVPVGYSQSAAGASLAAAAYFTQSWTPSHYAEYMEKATVDPSSDDIARAEDEAEAGSQNFDENELIFGWANPAHQVITYDGDYAKINVFMQDRDDNAVQTTVELRWVDGMWKTSSVSEMEQIDAIPEEASVWD